MLTVPFRHLMLRFPVVQPAETAVAMFQGLPVLQPLIARSAQGIRGPLSRFAIVVVLTLGVLLLPTPAGVTPQGHQALALFVFTASILALEPVSLPIAALMVAMAQVVLRIGTTQQAFEPFPGLWFF
jgi:sodium-dependent dicarboxylate transporter 2/3/5